MANITTRAGKGAPLSWNEADANFTNLNNDKIEAASPSTLTNKTVNLTSNTLTGTKAQFDTACSDDNFAYVGQANTFTQTQTISSGNLNLTGTAQRITGDFSNGTVASRLLFQTSTVNAGTNVSTIPNGAGLVSGFVAHNQADPTHSGYASMSISGTEMKLSAGTAGNGYPNLTYLPMTFHTGGSERMWIDTSGNVGIGSAPAASQGILQPYALFAGGTPAASGSTDANQLVAFKMSSAQMSFGTYANGDGWIQQRLSSNFATNYGLHLNPNGGVVYANGVEVGYKDVPANAQSTAYTLALTDRGKSVDTSAGVTVPPNSTAAFPVGATVSITNNSAASITITQGAGVTMYLAGTATTGNRTLAQRGVATVRKIATDTWIILGGGLT